MSRLRVCYVYDACYPEMNGGAERRYHELAVRLAADHDIQYVTWSHHGRAARWTANGVRYWGVGRPPAFYGSDGKRRVSEAVVFAARLVPTLLRIRADVLDVSATPTVPLYGVWLAATLTRTPLVVTWHEYWAEHWHAYLPESRLIATIARILEAGSRLAGDCIVVVSPYTASRMGEGRWAPKITIVGNGADVAEIAAAEPAAEPVDLVYLGRLIDEKRVELLVRAVAQLAVEQPTVCATVIGEGPERLRLQALALQLGVAARIRFTGPLSTAEVRSVLRAATALVLPSAREGYGIVVVEAQAAGAIPIVTSGPATAAPTLVDHAVDGFVVEATPDAIAGAYRVLRDDPSRRAQMRASAAERARAASWDAVAARMAEVYLAAARRGIRDRARARPGASTTSLSGAGREPLLGMDQVRNGQSASPVRRSPSR